jgi:hypothetical protein
LQLSPPVILLAVCGVSSDRLIIFSFSVSITYGRFFLDTPATGTVPPIQAEWRRQRSSGLIVSAHGSDC